MSADVVVVKLGGEVIRSEYLADLCADIADLGRAGTRVVMVHGGGPQATELQKQLGQTPNIVAGRRITDKATLDVMKMVVCGQLNVDLCAALVAAGAKPVGLHGASSCVVRAQKRPPMVLPNAGPEPIDFGHVGDVTGLNEELIFLLSKGGYVPVLACLGANAEGATFNINADAVANRVAVLLSAKALLVVSDVRGVLRDVQDPSSRIPSLTIAQGKEAIDTGVVTKGMIPKLEESFAAIREGVRAVHIVGRLGRGDLGREVRDPGSVGTVLLP